MSPIGIDKDRDFVDKLYREWERGLHKPNLTYPSLRGLYQWFLRECERREIDPQEIDFEAYVDSSLTYEENKIILAEMMRTGGLTEKEMDNMYEGYKANIEAEIREAYPEIIEPLEERIAELERTEHTSKRRYKKIKELERQLRETQRKLEEEKAKPPEVAPVKIRILKAFTEGIIDYTAGSVVETRDMDWALDKIERGLAERVAVEVPVEVKRPPPPPVAPPEEVFRPPPKKPPPDRERFLTRVFYAVLSRHGVPVRTGYRSRWYLELPAILEARVGEQEGLAEKFGMEIVKEYEAEKVRRPPERPPVTPSPPKIETPPGWEKVPNGYLTPMGEFISEEEYPVVIRKMLPWTRLIPTAKPPGLNLKNWLMWQHGLAWGDFLKLSDYERKLLLDEYTRLSEESV